MAAPDQKSELKRAAVHGGAVTLSAQMATILIQVASVITLSRLLPPSDFGIIAMLMAVVAFMALFRDMGLSTASIQKTELSRSSASALFWINLTAGLALTLVVLALAPLVAWFYNRPELEPVCSLLSLSFLITGAGVQHGATMQRELRFLPKAIADVSGAATSLFTSALLAWQGAGYWSLAWGTISGALATTALYITLGRFKPTYPKRSKDVREILGFGADVTGFELANYLSRNLDNILIGKLWGADALGMYSRAYQIMMLPINSLRTPINAVAFPVLSRLQNHPIDFRRYYMEIASLLAFLSMPLMAFLAVNAQRIIRLSLGPQWDGVASIFALLAVTGFIQPVASLRGMVLLSLGRSRRYLAWGLLNATAVCLAFIIGVNWGPLGIAIGYAISNYLILYPSLVFIFKDSPLKPIDFFISTRLPIIASLFAACANFAVLGYLKSLSLLAGISCALLVFAATYLMTFLIVPKGRRTLWGYVSLTRTLRGKSRP